MFRKETRKIRGVESERPEAEHTKALILNLGGKISVGEAAEFRAIGLSDSMGSTWILVRSSKAQMQLGPMSFCRDHRVAQDGLPLQGDQT